MRGASQREQKSPTELLSKHAIILSKIFNGLQLAVFIDPETAISINRNGSIPLCVFKTLVTADLQHRTTASSCRSSFSGHTGFVELAAQREEARSRAPRTHGANFLRS